MFEELRKEIKNRTSYTLSEEMSFAMMTETADDVLDDMISSPETPDKQINDIIEKLPEHEDEPLTVEDFDEVKGEPEPSVEELIDNTIIESEDEV